MLTGFQNKTHLDNHHIQTHGFMPARKTTSPPKVYVDRNSTGELVFGLSSIACFTI